MDMNMIKLIWPTPFKIKEKNVVSLVVQLVIFLVVCAVVGWLISLLAGIPVVGILFGIIGAFLEIYGVVGIVLSILKFLGMVK